MIIYPFPKSKFVKLLSLSQVVDEYKKALSGVLVSLSSASFRSNNFTDASGVLTYTSLVRKNNCSIVLLSVNDTVMYISTVDLWSLSFEAFVTGVHIPAKYTGKSTFPYSSNHCVVCQEFDLSSGESFEVEFVGKRVAFRYLPYHLIHLFCPLSTVTYLLIDLQDIMIIAIVVEKTDILAIYCIYDSKINTCNLYWCGPG